MCVVVAKSDERFAKLILISEAAQRRQSFGFCHCPVERHRMLQGNRTRHRLLDKTVERFKSECVQHRLDLLGIGTDVAIDKFASILQRAEGSYGVVMGRSLVQLHGGLSLHCHPYTIRNERGRAVSSASASVNYLL